MFIAQGHANKGQLTESCHVRHLRAGRGPNLCRHEQNRNMNQLPPDLQTKELNFNCQQFLCQISIPRFKATTKYSPPQMPTEGASNARITNLVGMIRLSVSGIHDQPYLPGLKRTWRSEVRNFHLQSRFDSLPVRSISHEKPLNVASVPGHVCAARSGQAKSPQVDPAHSQK